MHSPTQNLSQLAQIPSQISSQKTPRHESTTSNACSVCNKVSVYNMACRCGLYHCKRHRDPIKHNCSYDFATHANNQNQERLQKIEAQKIEVI